MTQTMNKINCKSLIVVGGRQRKNALDLDEWHTYETAIIAVVDTTTGKAEIVVEYQSPPEVCTANQPAIVFKAGDRRKDHHIQIKPAADEDHDGDLQHHAFAAFTRTWQ